MGKTLRIVNCPFKFPRGGDGFSPNTPLGYAPDHY